MKIKSLLLLLCLSTQYLSQVKYSETKFRSPLGITLRLAGNFAEMRSNHFHTGLDIKTNGREGYKIYAIDSGYISRINVSLYGYGNALYITHPNGYTSVYAHLQTFPKPILDYIRKKQFEKKSETIQVYPGKKFTVKKGEVVAYSGNSGSSSAPHLHFEIRETATEKPVNPLLFNFDIKDDKKPVIFDVKVYPLDGGAINNKSVPYNLDMKGANGNYQRAYDTPVSVKGSFGLAVNTIDYLNGANNKCGIYTIELQVDDRTIFKQKLEKLVFADNRYINTHSDYLEYRLKKQSYHKSFRSENNKLDIYETIVNEGYIAFDDTLTHRFKYIIKDAYGNTSEAVFQLKSEGLITEQSNNPAGKHLLDASSRNEIKENGFEADFERNTIYDDLKYDYKQSELKNTYSKLHQFGNDHIPIHKYFVLKLKTSKIPHGKEDKALIVEMSKNKKVAYAKGGEYAGGWIQTKVRSFGNYTVKIDTTAPVITPLNITDGKNMKGITAIQFKIADNLSGVDDYDIYVDGEWKLTFYNRKKRILSLPFADFNKIKSGKHELKIVVSDERKNTTAKVYNFIR